jgi:hypothetical protein
MIDNIQNHQVAHAMGSSTLPHAEGANRRFCKDSDATVQVNFADLIDQAVQTAETDADAVPKARELLQSGQLTTPENIRSAAQNIVTFGI